MEIQKIIKKRIFDQPFTIYDSKARMVDQNLFKENYIYLRNYISKNFGQSKPVAIMLKKDPNYLMAILACMECGVPYVPLREDYPENRIEQIKSESGFYFLLTQQSLKTILDEKSEEYTEVRPCPDDVLYTICTSGSTGKPKAVVVPRQALENFWNWSHLYFNSTSNADKVLQVADFTFDISLIDVGLFLFNGPCLYFSKFKGNIFTLALEIESYHISFLNTVVNNFNMLLEDSVAQRANLKSLTTVVMGGARFTNGLYNKCAKYFPTLDVHNLYGVTEVPVYSHAKKLNFNTSDFSKENISVGTPLGKTTALIIKNEKRAIPGEPGELLLGGGHLMKHYANNPTQTQLAFTVFENKKYYKTGDIAYQSKTGEYFIIGRLDDTIKYKGYRINLLDIDSYIQKLSYVENAVTFAIASELTQNTTICYIKLREEKQIKDIKKDLSKSLIDYQIPEKILIVDTFPLNENGKICKKTLKSYHLQGK